MASIDELAAALSALHLKKTGQVRVKWEQLDASERSLWRLIARKAFEMLEVSPSSQLSPQSLTRNS
jgi:hypothetical protein